VKQKDATPWTGSGSSSPQARARAEVLDLASLVRTVTETAGLATRPPALSDGAFAGTSLLPLVAVFNWRVLGLSPSHRLQGETHA